MSKEVKVTGDSKPEQVVNHVLIVLDESGSMGIVRQNTIDGFNEQLMALQEKVADNEETRVTMAIFSDLRNIRVIYEGEDAATVQPLNEDTYRPGGGTALYSAIEQGLNQMQMSVKDPHDPANAYLVIIISDGDENASSYEHRASVPERIKTLDAQDPWTFTYIGANVDITKIAAAMNLQAGNTAAYTSSPVGTESAFAATGKSLHRYRSMRSADLGVRSLSDFYEATVGSCVDEDFVNKESQDTPDSTDDSSGPENT